MSRSLVYSQLRLPWLRKTQPTSEDPPHIFAFKRRAAAGSGEHANARRTGSLRRPMEPKPSACFCSTAAL